MRVLVHEVTGNEIGWKAWCPDFLGFATWALTEAEVLARVAGKLDEHRMWLMRHGIDPPRVEGGIEVVERTRGNEVLFSPDRLPCGAADVDLTIRLLAGSRRDLIRTVEVLPEDALDWDPPYRWFAPWASWRTVRAVLAHIANTETHYYLPKIGYEPAPPPAPADGDWQRFLPDHRRQTISFLMDVRADADRVRISSDDTGAWSVRKVLGRLVRHELLHWRSIQRIGNVFEKRPGLNHA